MAINIRRRELIAALGGAAAWPFAARAQQPGRVWHIGFLSGVSRSAASDTYAAFVQGMGELGYVEGKDFVIEWRSVEGKYERIPEIATELVGCDRHCPDRRSSYFEANDHRDPDRHG